MPTRPRSLLEKLVTVLLGAAALVAVGFAVAGIGGDGGGADPAPARSSKPKVFPVGPRLVQVEGAASCLKGPASPSWTKCTVAADGLKDARSVAITSDGRFAYVASVEASTVVALARDEKTGALRPLAGRDGCVSSAPDAVECTRMRGLSGALTVTVSPDDRNVYVSSINAGAVLAFTRERSGALRRVDGETGCVSDVQTPVTGCAVGPALSGARWVDVSPDGRNVYVASPASDAIAVLRRNRSTGGLRPVAEAPCVRDERSVTSCPTTVPGLDEPRMLTVSPDGRNVYVAGEHSYAVVALQRSADTGALAPVPGAPCIEDVQAPPETNCPQVARGLNFAFFVAVSPDGRHVYTTATASDAVAGFARDPATGALTPLPGDAACIGDVNAPGPACPRRARGLDGAAALRFTRDGRYAYVASFYGGAVAVLERNRQTGALRTLGGRGACVSDLTAPSTPKTTSCPSHARGLEGPRDVVLSPDDRNAYVPSSVGGSVAVFRRQR